MRSAIIAASLLTAVMAQAAAAHDYEVSGLGISHPWSRATAPSQPAGGVFMTIENIGDRADRLVGASSPIAERADIHNTINDNGVMRMRPVETIDLPVSGGAELAPGGYHIMLIGLTEPLKQGTRIPVTLQFEHAGSIDIEVTVEAAGAATPTTAAAPEAGHDHGAHGKAEGHHNHDHN